MGKSIKTGFSVISAHTAFSHATEAHFGSGKVDDGVVDAAAAIGKFLVYPADVCFIAAEKILRQRLGTFFQKKHQLIKILIGKDR